MTLYSRVAVAFSLVFVALGVAILVRTAAAGGGVLWVVAGVLFVALGLARLRLERLRRRS